MHSIDNMLTDDVLEAAAKLHAKPEHALGLLQDFRSQLSGKLFAGTDTDAFVMANLIAVLVQAPREKKVMRRSKVMLRSVEPDKFAKVAVVNAIRYLAGVSLKVALDIAVNVNLGSVEEIEAEYDDESAAVLKLHGIEVIRAY